VASLSPSSFRLYRLHGLVVESPLDLPCPRARHGATPDVRLAPANSTRFAKARAAARPSNLSWFQCRRLEDGRTYLRWTDVFEFLVSVAERQILYRPLRHASAESLQVYLLGQALSFVLLSLGHDPLHGACVAMDGKAVAFVGECGYGKSTLAAALLARGHRLVTDDLIALEMRKDVCIAHPGLPRLKLFPSVARRLFGTAAPGAAMIHGTSKRILALGPNQSVRRPVPLAAIYVLEKPDRRRPVVAARIDGLSRRDAFLEIVRAAFNLAVLDRERYANQFLFASRLASSVPIRRLTYRRDFTMLPAACDALLADLAAF
jgi:hypothetical protein